MKLFLFSLVPAVTMAFSGPEATSIVLDQHLHTRGGELALKSTLDDTATSAVETTEKYVEKADDLVVGRLLRVVDHAPAFFTLKALADAAGVKLGLTPDSISALCTGGCDMGGVTTALDTPDFMSATVCKVYILSQMLSLAKSALASDGNELSQADITAVAAANFVATRAIGSSNPLRDTIVTALVSGYAVRNGSAAGDPSIHSVAPQLLSSFTTVLSVLGLVSAVAAKIPIVSDSANIISLLGIGAYYAIVTRDGNGTVKKAVNAGVLGGMLVNAVKDGISLDLSLGSLMGNIVLLATAWLAYQAIDSLKSAVFDDE